MRFFGVMKIQPTLSSCSRTGLNDTPHECFFQLPQGTLLLVSKYATRGNILAYLNNILTGEPTDWPEIIELMNSLASKLRNYHEANIVHR